MKLAPAGFRHHRVKPSPSPAMNAEASILNLGLGFDSRFRPAVVLGQGLELQTANKQPVAYFWKEVLPVGKGFRDGRGKPFDVTPERIDLLLSTFKRAKAKGFEPHLPDAHRKHERTRNYGYVVDARKNDRGSLELLHKVIGAQNIADIETMKSSICTFKDVQDEHGETYPELIEHNAILPDPQMNGLGGFVPVEPALAASSGREVSAEVFTLSAATQEPQMDIAELRKALGADASVPDADLIAFAGTVRKERDDLKPLADKVTALSTSLSEKESALELARNTAAKPLDPDLAHERRLRVADAVAKLGGTTAWNERAVKVLAGAEQAPDGLMLSRVPGGDLRAMDLLNLVASFERAPKAGEQTGAQVLELSRQVPGEKPDEAKNAADEARRQAEAWQKEQLAARGLSA